MLADTNATAGVDEARRGASLQIEFENAGPFYARSHPPRRQREQELCNTRQCFVSGRTNSTTRCSLSASTHDARCIARPHRAAVRWAVGNEWRQ